MGFVAAVTIVIVTGVVIFTAARPANQVAQDERANPNYQHHGDFGYVHGGEQNSELHRIQVLHKK